MLLWPECLRYSIASKRLGERGGSGDRAHQTRALLARPRHVPRPVGEDPLDPGFLRGPPLLLGGGYPQPRSLRVVGEDVLDPATRRLMGEDPLDPCLRRGPPLLLRGGYPRPRPLRVVGEDALDPAPRRPMGEDPLDPCFRRGPHCSSGEATLNRAPSA